MSDLEKHCATLLSKALGVSEDQIDKATSIHSQPAWDSLAHLRLIMSIEEHTHRRMTPDELVAIVDYKSVLSALKTAGKPAAL